MNWSVASFLFSHQLHRCWQQADRIVLCATSLCVFSLADDSCIMFMLCKRFPSVSWKPVIRVNRSGLRTHPRGTLLLMLEGGAVTVCPSCLRFSFREGVFQTAFWGSLYWILKYWMLNTFHDAAECPDWDILRSLTVGMLALLSLRLLIPPSRNTSKV